MSKKNVGIIFGLALVLGIAGMLIMQPISNAQECRIIRIDEVKNDKGESTVGLDPSKMTVAKGSCVVWINWSGQLVKVVFKEEAQRCSVGTDAHTGFKYVDNCFVSNMVPNAGTSSVRFNVTGKFRFEIVLPPAEVSETATDKVVATGEVIVE